MKKKLALFFLFGALLSACSDDDNDSSDNNGSVNTTTKLLPSVLESVDITTNLKGEERYTYDDQNRIITINSITREMDENGESTETIVEFHDNHTFTYDNENRVIKVIEIYKEIKAGKETINEETSYDLTYNADGKVILKIAYSGYVTENELIIVDNKLISDNESTYEYDSNNNLIKIKAKDTSHEEVISYKYDLTQNSIFQHCNTPSWITIAVMDELGALYSKNLITQITSSEKDTEDEYTNYTWSDNQKGYPTKLMIRSNTGVNHDATITYVPAK